MTAYAMAEPCPEARGWRDQFACPHGWLGFFVGHLMAIKNRGRSLWVLERLELREDARVLEIGFGSGVDVRRASHVVTRGLVAGIDRSAEMLRQAQKRNTAAAAQGRVDLRRGSSASLPWPDASFDVVFSINAAQFWKDAAGELAETMRVLRPGGRVTVAVQPRAKGAAEEDTHVIGGALQEGLKTAGFEHVTLEIGRLRPVPVALVQGHRPH